MPNNIIKSFAEKAGKSEAEVEKLWDKAKSIVSKEYPNIAKESDRWFSLVTGTLKKMVGLTESEKNLFARVITDGQGGFLDKVDSELKTIGVTEAVLADEIPEKAQDAAQTLQKELERVLPDFWKIRATYGANLGPHITVLAFDDRKESTKVTFHNSENIVHLMMHLSSGSGKAVDLNKVSWELLNSSYLKTSGVKYRKISDATIEGATKKLVAWFKKNAKAFADAPEVRESVKEDAPVLNESELFEASSVKREAVGKNNITTIKKIESKLKLKGIDYFEGIHGVIAVFEYPQFGLRLDKADMKFLSGLDIRWAEFDEDTMSVGLPYAK